MGSNVALCERMREFKTFLYNIHSLPSHTDCIPEHMVNPGSQHVFVLSGLHEAGVRYSSHFGEASIVSPTAVRSDPKDSSMFVEDV